MAIRTGGRTVLRVPDPADRPRARYYGRVQVAGDTAGQPPDFDLEPLSTRETRPEVYRAWFRRFIETRSAEPAERCLRTAIHIGLSPEQVAEMVFAACTDHLFLDDGHALDFASKGFELLDLIGWQHAEAILPSLIGPMVRATRMEEPSAWPHPADLPALLPDAFGELGASLEAGGRRPHQHGPPERCRARRRSHELVLPWAPAGIVVPLVRTEDEVASALAEQERREEPLDREEHHDKRGPDRGGREPGTQA